MSNAAERLPDTIVNAAIAWQMRLRAQAGDSNRQQFEDWLRHDPRHRLAWQRLQQMGTLFQSSQLLDATQTIPLLQRAEADLSRRRLLKLLGVGLAAGSATLLASNTPSAWHADFSTATGERRRLDLAGGTQVVLNTGSALDVQGHTLLLRAGEALVDGADWQLRCPFAECRGQQARVFLRERDGHSEIRVERGTLQVAAASGQRQLQAGEGLRVSATAMSALGQAPIDPFAWVRGLLVVDDVRLADFLAEAGRYRRGWLGCASAVADMRLSGVFRLDEPQVMFQNIAHLLPVRVVERTRWWVRVEPLA